ncbi:MerR family transcriptional regulator [Neobacillus niacini]|jgi:DNA-binding transcriptional MerR regulator|uniref:MerR family transcriptional regulator n=1 Tax=Neobacillus niacini TaxID=86668 RepID=UPI00203B660C|nr:MerR family transcriptional regulator [Neobacillus niacini]MCM3690826.1 MerR family transcriptional regulator [Neobacillus niacini]
MRNTIGEVAKKFNLNISTLRYYDKEGLIPNLEKNESGIRIFDEEAVSALIAIECLKKSGMSIKDIKTFIDWCQEGDETLKERLEMFLARREALQSQIKELESTLNYIEYKVEYYTKAVTDGTEKMVKETMSNPRLLNLQ